MSLGAQLRKVNGPEPAAPVAPEWDPAQHWETYTLGDLRTNGSRLWECIDITYSFWEPSGPQGYLGWREVLPDP